MLFFADQTLPPPSAEEIRALGNQVDLVDASTDAARRELVGRAARQGRIILTFDFDYHAIIFGDEELEAPPGVVCFQLDWETPRDPANLLAAVLTDDDLTIDGSFTLLEESRMRQKPMPG